MCNIEKCTNDKDHPHMSDCNGKKVGSYRGGNKEHLKSWFRAL